MNRKPPKYINMIHPVKNVKDDKTAINALDLEEEKRKEWYRTSNHNGLISAGYVEVSQVAD